MIQFLTAIINYGGRITDANDIRTADVIIKQFNCPDVLTDDYKFDPQGIYYSLKPDDDAPQKSYQEYIDQLPLQAGPGLFGMHENANIACAQAETFTLFDTFLLMEAQEGGGGGGASREELVGIACVDAETKLKKKGQFDIDQISLQYPVKYDESMNTVLLQECIRFNKLIAAMETSLPMLIKALKGLVVMNNELDAMANAIAMSAVPPAWEGKAYPSLKPFANWVDDLMERLSFIIDWVENGIPVVFWISG